MKHFLTVSILFFVLLLSGCGEAETSSVGSNAEDSVEASATTGIAAESPGERVSVSSGSFTRLSPGELRNMKENFPLVNVHVPFAGDIPGTDLSIPYNEIEENLDKLPPDKDAKIVLYCLGGPMSFDAAETLVKLGYTNISDLDGGMEAWQNAGFDLKGA